MPLTVTVHDRLDAIEPDEWRALFPGHPDSYDIVRLTADCGMDGFSFASIVVREGSKPILILPLFDVRFRIGSLLDGAAGKIVGAMAKILPGIFSPRLLGVGIVEGEWGQVGIDPAADEQAWELAINALRKEMRRRRAALLVLLNFTPQAVAALPGGFQKRLAAIDTIPCARLKIDFSSTDEYLSRLSKSTRKDLRRKLRSAEEIKIVAIDEVGPWLDRMYALYMDTVDRAELSLGIQRKDYFRRIFREVAGARCVLYLKDDQLLAFNLLVERDGTLIDKYFCMEPEAGRLHSLYFVSWMENLRYCCEKKLTVYHAGPGAEATKARLGAEFVPSITLFRHRYAPVHAVLKRLKRLIAYTPAIKLDGEGAGEENRTQ